MQSGPQLAGLPEGRFRERPTTAQGRYAKLSIATPMHRTQLCVGPRLRALAEQAARGLHVIVVAGICT
jgi:hypothetical protein